MSNANYENAPATALLATNCACCARPLLDSASVETGMGPVCREKRGFAAPDREGIEVAAALAATLPEAKYMELATLGTARLAANRLVYLIAARQDGPDVLAYTNALRALGFDTLAARITKRLTQIVIELSPEGTYLVKTPYAPETTGEWRRIPGRRWDKEAKVNTVPAASKGALWAFLRANFGGRNASGPKGLFVIA